MPSITSFALQYSNGNAAALLASHHDLLILEGDPLRSGAPGATVADTVLNQLQGQGRTVVGYVNLSVTDANRPYWQDEWTLNAPNYRPEDDKNALTASAPDWLVGQQSNPFGVVVKFWQPDWRSLVINQATNLVSRGYDGVFLDDVVTYFSFSTNDPAKATIAQRALAMMELVIAVDAAIRVINPDAYVVVNGAQYIIGDAGLSISHPISQQYRNAVDAILLENQGATAINDAVANFSGNADLLAIRTDLSDPGATAAFGQDMYEKGIVPHAIPSSTYNVLGTSPEPGTVANDALFGGNGPNLIRGFGGNDTLNGGSGANTLNGGGGTDKATYAFASTAATINKLANGTWTIASAANDVSDTLTGIERAVFTDKTLQLREDARSDFNGDGTADMVLQSGNTIVTWTIANGLYQAGSVITSNSGGFAIVGKGDFNADGTTDLLLQNGGSVASWTIQNGAYQSGTTITTGAAGFSVVAVGDFDGDLDADIVLQGNGTVVAWIMQNGVYQSGSIIATGTVGYKVVGAGDLDGDGDSDLVLQNGGTVVSWIMQNGVYQSGRVLTTAATGFTVRGVGDFNGDGTSDIVLQNGGTVVDWIMRDGAYQSGNVITTGAVGATVVGTGDFNNDGTTDISLQAGGTIVDWIMQAGLYQSGNVITTGATGYMVQ